MAESQCTPWARNSIHVWRWQRWEKLAPGVLVEELDKAEERLGIRVHKDELLHASYVSICKADIARLQELLGITPAVA